MSTLNQIQVRASPLSQVDSLENRATVVSHSKDADGICSAALINHLTGANVILTDYAEMTETMEKVPPSKEIFICDLGLNKTTFGGFVRELNRLLKYGKVHYMDHHPIDAEYSKKLNEIGIDLYHSRDESAAVLVYKKFESLLDNDPKMKILACCGAITDYMDLQPFARKLISSFDRQFLLYEATVISFSIAIIGRDGPRANPLLEHIVEELGRKSILPHEIDNAASYAQEFAANSALLIEKAKRDGRKMKNFAYIISEEASAGNLANFLIGALDVSIGVAFREAGPDHYEVSLRSIQQSDHDLGKIVGKISNELFTSGGGHAHAAGSRINKDQFDRFIERLDSELSSHA